MLLQTTNDHFNPFSYQPKNKLRKKKNSHARKLCPLHQIEQQIRFNEQNALVTFIFVPLVLLNNSQAYCRCKWRPEPHNICSQYWTLNDRNYWPGVCVPHTVKWPCSKAIQSGKWYFNDSDFQSAFVNWKGPWPQ